MSSLNYDVIALGELLIDFTDYGISGQNNPVFEANPGGAPGNVLAMLAKLGKRTAFIGKVGDDMFGRMVTDALKKCGIDTRFILVDSSANTTLAFVRNAPDGEREFSFFRKPGADTMLCTEELPRELSGGCKILHIGTLSLTHKPSKDATIAAVTAAKNTGALVSFDPNLRPLLWDALDDASKQISWGLSVCDIVKIADDELRFITGENDLATGITQLRAEHPQIKLILLTKGRGGAECFWCGLHAEQPAFLTGATIDTTGAGDAFMGACLSFVLDAGLEHLALEKLEQMLAFASAAASLVTTKKGALLSMPEKAEVQLLIKSGTAL